MGRWRGWKDPWRRLIGYLWYRLDQALLLVVAGRKVGHPSWAIRTG